MPFNRFTKIVVLSRNPCLKMKHLFNWGRDGSGYPETNSCFAEVVRSNSEQPGPEWAEQWPA